MVDGREMGVEGEVEADVNMWWEDRHGDGWHGDGAQG